MVRMVDLRRYCLAGMSWNGSSAVFEPAWLKRGCASHAPGATILGFACIGTAPDAGGRLARRDKTLCGAALGNVGRGAAIDCLPGIRGARRALRPGFRTARNQSFA